MKRFLQGLLISIGSVLILYFLAVYVPAVFRGDITPNPVLFNFAGLPIRWYGILIAAAVTISYLISAKRFEKNGIETNASDNTILIVVLLGLIGARIGFVIQDTHFFLNNPFQIIAIWSGGLSIHGAILGGILGLLLSGKIYKLQFIKIANIIAPQLMLAGAIGRWGNFFNQEIIGKPVNVLWKMFVPVSHRPELYKDSSFFHPVFLYESILLFAAFGVYLAIRKRIGDRLGFSYTLIIYSAIRIIVEFWRIDYKPIFYFLDLSQIVSFAIIAIGVFILFFTRSQIDK